MAGNNQQPLLGALQQAEPGAMDQLEADLTAQIESSLANLGNPQPQGQQFAFNPDPNLQAMANPPPERNTGVLGDLGTNLKAGFLKVPSALTGLADLPTGLAGFGAPVSKGADALGDAIGLDFDGRADEVIAEELRPETIEGRRALTEADGFTNTLKAALENPTAAVGLAVESLPGMLAGGGIAGILRGLTKGALGKLSSAAIGEGSIAAGMGQAESLTDDELTQTEAVANLVKGAGVATFGALGGRVAQKLGVTDADVFFAGGGMGKGSGRLLSRVTGGAVTEGLFEEMPQSVFETMVDNFANGEDLTQGIGNSAALGLVLGGTMGGAFNLLSGTGERGATPGATDDGGGNTEGGAPNTPDVPPSLAAEVLTPEGQAKSQEYYGGLTNDQLLSEWERLSALEQQLLTENTPESAEALGVLNNFMSQVSNQVEQREIRPEQRDVVGMAAAYRNIDSQIKTIDSRLEDTTLRGPKRVALQEKKIALLNRQEVMRGNFDQEELNDAIFQLNFNDLEESIARAETKANKATGDKKQEAIDELAVLNREKLDALKIYPEMEYTGDPAVLEKARGKSKKQAQKAATEKQTEKQTEAQKMQTVRIVNPVFEPIAAEANPAIKDDAIEGLQDADNTAEIEKLVSVINQESLPDERVLEQLDKEKAELDKQDGKKGKAKLRKKAAARVAVVEKAARDRGLTVPTDATPIQPTAETATPRPVAEIFKAAMNPEENFAAFEDVDIDAVVDTVWSELEEGDKFITNGRAAARREVRKMLERGSIQEMNETSLKPRAAKWRKVLAQKAVDSALGEGADLATLARQQRRFIPEGATELEALEIELVDVLLTKAENGEEVNQLSNMLTKQNKLKSEARKTLTRYAALSPEEFVNARPSNVGRARTIYEGMEQVQANRDNGLGAPIDDTPIAPLPPAGPGQQVEPQPPVEPAFTPAPEPEPEIESQSEATAEMTATEVPTAPSEDNDARQLLYNWIGDSRHQELRDFDIDDLYDLGVLFDEMGDGLFSMDYAPYLYYTELMAQPVGALSAELETNAALNAYAEDMFEDQDRLVLGVFQKAAAQFRAAELAGARERSSGIVEPVDPTGPEADALMSLTDFGVGDGPVMQKFFNLMATGDYESAQELTDAVSEFFTKSAIYAVRTPQEVRRVVGRTADKMYRALANMRGYQSLEQSKAALPMLADYLEGDEGETRFRNAYWEKEFFAAAERERKIEEVTLPAEQRKLSAMKQGTDEYAEQKVLVESLAWNVRNKGETKVVKARRAWRKEHNFVRGKDKESRTALFYDEMVSTSDDATLEAALGTYEQPILSDVGRVGVDIPDYELTQADMARRAIMVEIMESVGDERVRRGELGTTELTELTTKELKKAYKRRVKKSFSLRALGFTDATIHQMYQAEARQEFLSEAILVLERRKNEAEGLLEQAGTFDPVGESADNLRRRWSASKLNGKPTWGKLLEYPSELNRLLNLQTVLDNQPRDKWLNSNRLRTIIESGELVNKKATEGLNETINAQREVVNGLVEEMTQRIQTAVLFNDFKAKKGVPFLFNRGDIARLVEAGTKLYKTAAPQRDTESAKDFAERVAAQRLFVRSSLEDGLKEFDATNKLLYSQGKSGTSRERIRTKAVQLLSTVQAEIDSPNIEENLQALTQNETRNRLKQMSDEKARDTIMRAHLREVIENINEGYTPDAVDVVLNTTQEYEDAVALQRYYATQYNDLLANADKNTDQATVDLQRKNLMDEFHERQMELRKQAIEARDYKYDASKDPNSMLYKDRVRKSVTKRAKSEDVSVPDLVRRMRDVYLHDHWLTLPDNRRIALGRDNAVYTVIKEGRNWILYRPSNPDAMPNTQVDERVGKTYTSFKAAQEAITDVAFLKELKLANGTVYTAEQADAIRNDLDRRVAEAMEINTGVGKQIMALKLEARNRVQASVNRLVNTIERLNKQDLFEFERQLERGNYANTHGETNLYRAIQLVLGETFINEESVEGGYLVDVSDISAKMRQLVPEAPISPKYVLQSAVTSLYGPNPEPNITLIRTARPSPYEELELNGLVTIGNPNGEDKLIIGINEVSQNFLRNPEGALNDFDTRTFTQRMSVTDLRIMAELHGVAWEPDVSKVALLADLLRQDGAKRQASARRLRLHAPIFDISPATPAKLFNAELAEAWTQVFGDEKHIPVLVHKAASSMDAQEIEARKPKYRFKSIVDTGDASLTPNKQMSAAQVEEMIERLGYDKTKQKITVVQSRDDIPNLKNKVGADYVVTPAVKALYVPASNGNKEQIYLIADNLSESNVAGAIAHELTHKLFTQEEIGRLASLVRAWANDTKNPEREETVLAQEAISMVQGSLDWAAQNGTEITQKQIDHETAAYMLQVIADKGTSKMFVGPTTNMKVLQTATDWLDGKLDDVPTAEVTGGYFKAAILQKIKRLFKRIGFTSPQGGDDVTQILAGRLSAEHLALALADKTLRDQGPLPKPPTDPQDILASISHHRNAATKLGDRNLERMPEGVKGAGLSLRGYVRRATKRLEFADVFVENGETEFYNSEALDGANPLRYVRDAKVRRQRDAQVIVERINVALSPLSQMTPQRVRAMDSFIEKSTRQAQWGFVPTWANAAQPANQSPELFNEFAKFNAKEQQVIKDVFRMGEELRDELDAQMEAEIIEGFNKQRSEALTQESLEIVANAEAEAIAEFRKKRGPRQAAYAKLQLQGKWAVSYISQELRDEMASPTSSRKRIAELKGDGNKHYFVAFAESERLAEKLRQKMIRENGYDPALVGEAFPRMEQQYDLQMTEGMLQALDQKLAVFRDAAEATENDQAAASYNQLSKALHQVYITQLAENDLRKSELGRDNVATFDQDMIGNFARSARTLANNIAAVRTNRDVQTAMRELTSQAQYNTERRKYRMEVLNEQLRRHAIDSTYQESPLVNKLLSVTSFKMLLTSPGYYMQNAMQPIMYTLPRIAGDFGNVGGVARELLSEQKNMAKIWAKSTEGKNRFDISGRLQGTLFNPELVKDPGERALLEHLGDLNLFDVGMQAELGRVGTPGISATGGPIQGAVEMYNKMFQTATGAVRSVEIINRGAAATVAYRRFKKAPQNLKKYGAGADLEQAARDYAVFIVRRTQGDYSFTNQPSAFKPKMLGEWSRLATQFRSFQVIQWTILLTEFKRAFRDPNASEADRAAARRTLMYLGMTHFSAAGMLGLPLMGASNFVSQTIAAALGDEEEPSDMEFILYDAMGNNTLADVMIHGFPALLGINATPKLGMGTGVITPFLDAEWTKEYPALWAGTVMLGASGGMIGDLIGGVGLMSDGFVLEGAMKAVAPRGVRDAVLNLREAGTGVRKYNQRRDVLIPSEELSGFGQFVRGLGWDTTQINFSRAENRWVTKIRENVADRSTKIQGDFVKAARDGDTDGMNRARHDFIKLQAARVNLGLKRQNMSILTDSVKRGRQAELNTSDTGVQYQRTERVLKDRFARE